MSLPKPAREMAAASTAMSLTSFVFNPFDVVKTKLQTQKQLLRTQDRKELYTGVRHCFRTLLQEQGFVRGLWWPGLTASMLRDVINGGIRMGLYPTFAKGIQTSFSGAGIELPGLAVKILAGWTTGCIGAMAGNPTDMIKVRLQAESGLVENGVYSTGLYKGSAPAYRSASDAFLQLIQTDGARGLFRGAGANVARAALVTSGQMASYDQTKESLQAFASERVRVGIASFVSGIVAATVAAPADLVRSRVMDDRGTRGAGALYSGAADCVAQTVRNEGVLALWRGWVPAYMRLGPQFMVSFPLMELLRTRVFGLSSF